MTAALDAPPEMGVRDGTKMRPARLILGLLGVFVTGWLMANIFLSLAYYPQWYYSSRLLMGLVGMIAGIGGSALLF